MTEWIHELIKGLDQMFKENSEFILKIGNK